MDHFLDGGSDGERAFFERRLEEERRALASTSDPARMWRHRRLITRYELVLSLYEGVAA